MTASAKQNAWFRRLEQGYALLGLLLMVGALMPILSGTANIGPDRAVSDQVRDGSLRFQAFSAAIYTIAMLVLLTRRQEVAMLIARNKALVMFVVYIVISALWSDLPGVTIRRSLALFGTTIFAVYLAVRFKPSEMISLLALALAITVVEQQLLVILSPETSIHWRANYGAWKGGLGHKNIMGRTMVLAILVLWVAAPQHKAMKPMFVAVILLAIFLTIMTQSRTSWIAATCLVLAVPFLRHLRRSRVPIALRVVIVMLIGLGGIGFLVLEYAPEGLSLLGRDETFSGRTQIWAAAIKIGEQHPMLGSGYRTFFTRGLTTNTVMIGNGHNSFIDLWLELGFVGLGMFFASLVIVTRRALQRLVDSDDRRGFWYIMFIIFMILFGLAAQVFPDHGTIPWVLYVTTSLYLSPMVTVPLLGRIGGMRPSMVPPTRGAPAAAE